MASISLLCIVRRIGKVLVKLKTCINIIGRLRFTSYDVYLYYKNRNRDYLFQNSDFRLSGTAISYYRSIVTKHALNGLSSISMDLLLITPFTLL